MERNKIWGQTRFFSASVRSVMNCCIKKYVHQFIPKCNNSLCCFPIVLLDINDAFVIIYRNATYVKGMYFIGNVGKTACFYEYYLFNKYIDIKQPTCERFTV